MRSCDLVVGRIRLERQRSRVLPRRALPGRRHGRCHADRAAAHDEHVGIGGKPTGFIDSLRHVQLSDCISVVEEEREAISSLHAEDSPQFTRVQPLPSSGLNASVAGTVRRSL
jgi:hypothetical protein